jgi:hypothetical protein
MAGRDLRFNPTPTEDKLKKVTSGKGEESKDELMKE